MPFRASLKASAPKGSNAGGAPGGAGWIHGGAPSYHERSEEHTSELQSLTNLVCRLLLDSESELVRVAVLEHSRQADFGRATKKRDQHQPRHVAQPHPIAYQLCPSCWPERASHGWRTQH